MSVLLDLESHGAEHHRGAAAPFIDELTDALAPLPDGRAGLRLKDVAGLAALLKAPSIAALVGDRRPVRAILFDKSEAVNWALGWHQDRTIAVCEPAEVAGYGPWSVKQGMAHVEPPFALIDRMRTLRIHLDAVPADNAPLLIAPGSHRLGRVREAEVEAMVARCGAAMCLGERGDIWCYATPILHASAAAKPGARRRVLQVDFSADRLPEPLQWLGI